MKKVKVHLFNQSEGKEYTNVKNSYTKDGLFCLYLDNDVVHKYPLINIFRIEEDYEKQKTEINEKNLNSIGFEKECSSLSNNGIPTDIYLYKDLRIRLSINKDKEPFILYKNLYDGDILIGSTLSIISVESIEDIEKEVKKFIKELEL